MEGRLVVFDGQEVVRLEMLPSLSQDVPNLGEPLVVVTGSNLAGVRII